MKYDLENGDFLYFCTDEILLYKYIKHSSA